MGKQTNSFSVAAYKLTKCQAFRKQQLELSTMRERDKSLRCTIADVDNAGSSDKYEEPQQKHKKSKNNDLKRHRAHVNHLAHKCVILYTFWLYKGKETFTMEADPNYAEVNRFETSDSKAQGQRADFLELLPQFLQTMEIMQSDWFADRVSLPIAS